MAAASMTRPRPREPRAQPRRLRRDGVAPNMLDQIMAYQRPLTVPELAAILGKSRASLYRMAERGDIPQFNLPGCNSMRFDAATICYWLRKHNPILNQVAKAS